MRIKRQRHRIDEALPVFVDHGHPQRELSRRRQADSRNVLASGRVPLLEQHDATRGNSDVVETRLSAMAAPINDGKCHIDVVANDMLIPVGSRFEEHTMVI